MSEKIKWSSTLSEIERMIPILESDEDSRILLDRFESIDEHYRDQNFSQLYLSLWKVALKIGKLNLANLYAKKSLQYLISFKRIPQIKIFIQSLHDAGIFKKNTEEFLIQREILLGKKNNLTKNHFTYIDLMEDHPEHWKEFSEFLKQYLLLESEWTAEQWKFCYEYILTNHYDKEIFLSLLEKTHELNKVAAQKKFMNFLSAKKVRIKNIELNASPMPEQKKENLHMDYDQLAMELLSGNIEPTDEEQRRVLNSLKFIPAEDLKSKGQDMVVAFELLGMEQVVLNLCEQLVKIFDDVKQKASIYYVWAQALNNKGDYFKTIDLVDEVLQKEPLYEEERLAFLYLKAEASLKLKKIKMAKALYLEIKKHNPHYRLVSERLKAIETIK